MDTFIYFAYGSNMLTERLRARCPSAEIIGTADAHGYKICFDKKSKKDGSGKATLVGPKNDSDIVYGVLFRINKSELPDLDDAEGKDYRRENDFPVISSGKKVYTITYIAEKNETELFPYDWYLALVIAGALQHQLPNDYVEKLLTNYNATHDIDERRSERIKALCFLEQAGYKTVYQEIAERPK